MGAMVDKALPLAQQDAATATSIAQENANRETQVSSLNAQLGTDVSKFNAEQLNQAERLAAEMKTAVSQGNADAYNKAEQQLTDLQTKADLAGQELQTRVSELNAQLAVDVSKFNASEQNEAAAIVAQMETAVSQGNADALNKAEQQLTDLQARADLTAKEHEFQASLQYAQDRNSMVSSTQAQINEINKQYLAGSQAVDLAQIQGQFNNLISQNESAASMFDSYLTGLSSVMSNEDLGPERVAEYVALQTRQVTGSLQFIQDLNDLELEDLVFEVPGIVEDEVNDPLDPDPTTPPPATTTPGLHNEGGGLNR